jgi:hypothetical protein
VFVDERSEKGEEEKKIATVWRETNIETKVKRADNVPYEIVQIEQATPFYRAEEYHQRYWEKQRLRALLTVALVAGSSGAYDGFFNGAVGDFSLFGLPFDTLCNGVFLVGAGWMLLERSSARDVRELKSGDLAAMVLEGEQKERLIQQH